MEQKHEEGLRISGEVRRINKTKSGKFIIKVETDNGDFNVLSKENGMKKGDKVSYEVGLFDQCSGCGAHINGLVLRKDD